MWFEVEDCQEDSIVFPLLRHIGRTPRYAIPPRSAVLCQRHDDDAPVLRGWRRAPSLGRFLKSIGCSLPPAAVGAAMILLKAFCAEAVLPAVLLVAAAVLCAVVT